MKKITKIKYKGNRSYDRILGRKFYRKSNGVGFEPSDSAILTKDFFLEKQVKDIFIPGFGYGRNAKAFIDNVRNVTDIEISKTAVKLL